MSSISFYKRKGSPYYYLRIYKSEHLEPDPKKRRTSKTTKIPTTKAGERQIKNYVKQLNAALVRKEHQSLWGIETRNILLSEGTKQFLDNKPDLARKTIETYELAARKMIAACSDKYINRYYDSDYTEFVKFLNKKNFSESSKSIFTRHLSAMWNYFISQKWTDNNIIIKIKSTKTNTMPIPFKEMQKILTYYHEKNKEQYYLVYFLLLTGMRPSSALVIQWPDVDLTNKILIVNNVKGKRTFNFPIHSELLELLQDIGVKKKGKIFSYTTPPKFFNNDCKKLFLRGNLGHPYTIYQLRNTFSSWLANKGVNISTLQKLLDHTDQKITDKHYTKFELDYLRNEIEKAKFKEKPTKKH